MSDKKWLKARHKVMTEIVRPIFTFIGRIKYGARIERFKEEGERNWLILSNHQTDFDQFFVGLSFKKPVYYVASEDIFSNGIISRLLEWAVAPIPILKASTDIRAVKTCMRVAKEGGNICLFPEGNRTYSGKTCYIKPSVSALAKSLKLPIAFYNFEGGYGAKPRWADNCRKGGMTGGVKRILYPEDYADMSKDELYELICKELYVDETADGRQHRSSHLAEGLERAFYVCPECGFSHINTNKNKVKCAECGCEFEYMPDKTLKGAVGEKIKTVAEWYDYQENFVRDSDLSEYETKPLYKDRVKLSKVIIYKHKVTLKNNAEAQLYSNRLCIDGETFAFDVIKAMTCVGCHKLNIYYGNELYQLKGAKHFNALKYCNIYYHSKYQKEENRDGEFQFLGL